MLITFFLIRYNAIGGVLLPAAGFDHPGEINHHTGSARSENRKNQAHSGKNYDTVTVQYTDKWTLGKMTGIIFKTQIKLEPNRDHQRNTTKTQW